MSTDSSNKKIRKIKSERGFIFIVMPFVVIMLITTIGLVVDSANLYSASLKASAASEAAVTSSVSAYINEKDQALLNKLRTDEVFEKNYLEARVNQGVFVNLERNGVAKFNPNRGVGDRSLGYLPDQITKRTKIDRDPISGIISVTAEAVIEVPTLIMHLVSPESFNDLNKVNRVTALAKAQIPSANIIFVVDLSSSQNCPTDMVPGLSGFCICNTRNNTVNGVKLSCRDESNLLAGDYKGKLKSELLVSAIKKTLTRLDPRKDRVSIVGFNNSAFVLFPFNDKVSGVAKRGFDINQINQSLDSILSEDVVLARLGSLPNPVIVPKGNTNISDGLITAYEEAREAGLTKANGQKFDVIFYSDGGATAMRGNIDLNTDSDNYAVSPRSFNGKFFSTNFSKRDYINYQVTIPAGGGTYVQAPGPFVKTSQYKIDYSTRVTGVKLNGSRIKSQVIYEPYSYSSDIPKYGFDDAQVLPNCMLSGGLFSPNIYNPDKDVRSQAFLDCLSGLNFSISSNKNGGDKFNFFNSFAEGGFPDFRYYYYLAALDAAEYLRNNGGRIYSVGYGLLAPSGVDPIQGVDDVSQLKGEMMANLASDYHSAINTEKNQATDFKNNIFPSYKSLEERKKSGVGGGAFYSSPDPQGFENLLQSLISLIKLRLIKLG